VQIQSQQTGQMQTLDQAQLTKLRNGRSSQTKQAQLMSQMTKKNQMSRRNACVAAVELKQHSLVFSANISTATNALIPLKEPIQVSQ
jgi:hypothetical protein